MLQEFKNFKADRLDLDEVVAVAAFGRALRAEYEALNVPIPEFVDDNLRAIRHEIDSRLSDRRAARARELKQQIDALKSRSEKREELEKELASYGPH